MRVPLDCHLHEEKDLYTHKSLPQTGSELKTKNYFFELEEHWVGLISDFLMNSYYSWLYILSNWVLPHNAVIEKGILLVTYLWVLKISKCTWGPKLLTFMMNSGLGLSAVQLHCWRWGLFSRNKGIGKLYKALFPRQTKGKHIIITLSICISKWKTVWFFIFLENK